ncbi:MAG: thiamine diphosphokinase [Balneolaceae bacterium]|nr:thiamine diphosphokinase [Balneolaceae bacterium]
MHALVLCHGTPPSQQLLDSCLQEADYFVAADGGALTARTYDRQPDVVIGDLDSFGPGDDEPFPVIFDGDQETNDLQKALAHALGEGARQGTVLGATGRRLDQTLKNLSVLKRFDGRFERLRLRDNHGDTFLLARHATLRVPEETLISLFPLSGRVTGVTTEGLAWSLDDETLENGVRDGSSNRAVAEKVVIRHESGDLLAFVAGDYLYQPAS